VATNLPFVASAGRSWLARKEASPAATKSALEPPEPSTRGSPPSGRRGQRGSRPPLRPTGTLAAPALPRAPLGGHRNGPEELVGHHLGMDEPRGPCLEGVVGEQQVQVRDEDQYRRRIWTQLPVAFRARRGPFSRVPSARLERALAYRRLALIELAAQMAFYLVALTLAYRGLGVWAPIGGRWLRNSSAWDCSTGCRRTETSAPLGVGQDTCHGEVRLGIFGLDLGVAVARAGQSLGGRLIRRGRCGGVRGPGHSHSGATRLCEGRCLAAFDPCFGSHAAGPNADGESHNRGDNSANHGRRGVPGRI
jgi:hypothetical protein